MPKRRGASSLAPLREFQQSLQSFRRRLEAELTEPRLQRPRQLCKDIQSLVVQDTSKRLLSKYTKAPAKLPPLLPNHLQAFTKLVQVAATSVGGKPLPSRPRENKVPSWSAAERVRAAVMETFAQHAARSTLGAAAYWIVSASEEAATRVSLALHLTEDALLTRFLEPAQLKLSRQGEAVELAELKRRVEAADPAELLDLSLTGNAAMLHGAIQVAATQALRWQWVGQVIEAWRYAAGHAHLQKERAYAAARLRAIGGDLVAQLPKRGAPTLPEPATFRRRKQLLERLHGQIKLMKGQWRIGGRSPRAIKFPHDLTRSEFARMLELFETVEHGRPMQIARELAAGREMMTAEGLRAYFNARRRAQRES